MDPLIFDYSMYRENVIELDLGDRRSDDVKHVAGDLRPAVCQLVESIVQIVTHHLRRRSFYATG